MKNTLIPVLFLIATLPALAQSGQWRSWTSADGRALEAQLISVTEDSVTVKRRTDLRTITIQFDQLSEADQTFALAEFKKQQMGSANAAAEEVRTRGLKDGKYKDLFAATILSASGGSPGDVDKIKNFPIWQFHGELDADSPVEAARKMAEAMKTAGAPNYTYSELLQKPHSISGEIYPNAEYREWLFSWKKTEDGSVRE